MCYCTWADLFNACKHVFVNREAAGHHILDVWQALEAFVTDKGRIGIFDSKRNDPNEPKALSNLSPYIHFGQLGMQAAALEAIKHKSKFRVRAAAAA